MRGIVEPDILGRIKGTMICLTGAILGHTLRAWQTGGYKESGEFKPDAVGGQREREPTLHQENVVRWSTVGLNAPGPPRGVVVPRSTWSRPIRSDPHILKIYRKCGPGWIRVDKEDQGDHNPPWWTRSGFYILLICILQDATMIGTTKDLLPRQTQSWADCPDWVPAMILDKIR